MSTPPKTLTDGYERFRSGKYREEADRYATLEGGQAPETMIVACADSRIDPATIFNAAPGELFVVRNVANLVPPCLPVDASLHGTSAALEFAVVSLKVRNIVVMGHGGCGGIAASLALGGKQPVGKFIEPWVKLLEPARDALTDGDDRQTALEQAGVRQSLRNLETFPFIADAIAEGRLSLYGAWFSIGLGELVWLD